MKNQPEIKNEKNIGAYTREDLSRFAGYKLNQLCKLNNISKRKLSALLNVSNVQVHKYIFGTNMVPAWVILKLCQYFNVDANYFFPGMGDIVYLPLLRDEYDKKSNSRFRDVIRALMSLKPKQINMINEIIYELYSQKTMLDKETLALEAKLKDIEDYE